MRKINNKGNKPSKLVLSNCKTHIEKSIANIGVKEFKYSTTIYRDASVIKKLEILYNSKCVFCESDPSAGSALQVEHYRPKKEVFSVTGHNGYYWLGYEWSNLTYACSKCNRAKSNHFPIKKTGIRVFIHPQTAPKTPDFSRFHISDPQLIAEKPLIINPEVTDPSSFFTFLPSGKIRGKGQEEADETIKVCKLNRKPLVLKRRRIKDDLLKSCMEFVKGFNKKDLDLKGFEFVIHKDLNSLLYLYVSNKEYSVFAKCVFINFKIFIINRFSNPNDKKILLDAYNSFLTKAAKFLK